MLEIGCMLCLPWWHAACDMEARPRPFNATLPSFHPLLPPKSYVQFNKPVSMQDICKAVLRISGGLGERTGLLDKICHFEPGGLAFWPEEPATRDW